MIAIWPAGPPKLIIPSFSQKRNACPSLGFAVAARAAALLVAGGLAVSELIVARA
jgi:hypothetical protein